MRGVWYTTGGSAGATIAAAAAVAIVGAEWVIAHLWVILAVGVLCAVGTAAAVHRLIVWSDRRAVRVWAQRPAQLRVEQVTEISRPQRRRSPRCTFTSTACRTPSRPPSSARRSPASPALSRAWTARPLGPARS